MPTFHELAAVLPAIRTQGDLGRSFVDVQRDNRQLGEGTCFVAIRGARFDGHSVLSRLGACAGVIVESLDGVPPGLPAIEVADTRQALGWAASLAHGQPSRVLRTIGVTGTNGKTSTTTLIAQGLDALGVRAARVGTTGTWVGQTKIPTQLTTPEADTFQRLLGGFVEQGVGAVAFEASSIGLELGRLNGVETDVAVFTNLTRDHLDFHGDMGAYAQAKSRLFRQLLRPAGGTPRAILCGDDPAWPEMQPPSDRWLYGRGSVDVRLVSAEAERDGTVVTIDGAAGKARFRVATWGEHNALNATAAWAAIRALDLPAADCLDGAVPAAGRFERVGTGEPLVVVDYAHAPDAIRVAIAAMRRATPGNVWIVFGCGGDRDAGKRPQMGRAAEAADRVVITSDNPRSEDPLAIIAEIRGGMSGSAVEFVDRAEAIAYAITRAQPGDGVLIAGKGHETTQEIDGCKYPFDDREVALRVLEAR